MEKINKMDQVMETHFMLKLFFLFMCIITVVTSLFLMTSFENEFLGSDTGTAIETYSGIMIYVIMFFVIIYFLVWIIYRIFKNKMLGEMEDDYE